MKLSIVTPCYYNEKNLEDTYAAVRQGVFDRSGDTEWEWILVDDGSGDRTLEVARELQARDGRIKIVKLSRNFGEFRAIVAGLSVAEGEAVAVISADLQDPPEMILRMMDSWKQGSKVNLAVRRGRDRRPAEELVCGYVLPADPKMGDRGLSGEGIRFFRDRPVGGASAGGDAGEELEHLSAADLAGV